MDPVKAAEIEAIHQRQRVLGFPLVIQPRFVPGMNNTRGLADLLEACGGSFDQIVEIGSFAGVSSELLSHYCRQLYCVDMWDVVGVEPWRLDLAAAEQRFEVVFKRRPNIEKIKGESVEVSKQFADRSMDLAYIDAAHDYEAVRKDIAAWEPKVKRGGYIAGHDYQNNFTGVQRAVNEVFGPVASFPDSSWVVRIQ